MITSGSRLPYLWMLAASCSFAVMGALTYALRFDCDWQTVAIVRSLCVLGLSLGLALYAGVQLVFWKPPMLWLRSLCGSISVLCNFYALTRLPVADVLTLTNMFPLWIALLSWPLLGERPSRQIWLLIASGLVGVVLVLQPHFAEGNFASLVAVLSSLTSALAMLGLNRLGSVDARAVVVHFSLVSLLVCLLASGVPGSSVAPAGWPTLLVVAGLCGVGLTATCGQILLTKAFAMGPAAQIAVVGLTQVPLAMLLDVLCWNRQFNPLTLCGMALVLAPTGWLLLKLPRKRSATETVPVAVAAPSVE